MKFRVNDQVIITSGKDKGRKSKIIQVLPAKDQVVVEGVNMYTRHIRKMMGRPGEKIRRERPLSTAKIAIINDKGQADRIGFVVDNGTKKRIYKKTKTVMTES
ncbi:50S ribosomal protein L24 [bacterium]|nr:50S ribosomal protein L24 [bacterium]